MPGFSNITKSAFEASLLPDSGMKNRESPSVEATMSSVVPFLLPRTVATPEAYTLP